MSTGIPVVATTCIPRCLQLGEGCSIVPVDDAQALAAAMHAVMENGPIDGASLSAQVATIASPRAIGRQLEQLFSEVMGK